MQRAAPTATSGNGDYAAWGLCSIGIIQHGDYTAWDVVYDTAAYATACDTAYAAPYETAWDTACFGIMGSVGAACHVGLLATSDHDRTACVLARG